MNEPLLSCFLVLLLRNAGFSRCCRMSFYSVNDRAWAMLFIYLLKNLLFYIGVELVNTVVLVSGVQQSDSVIHIHISILFQIIFPYRLLQSIILSIAPCAIQ